MKAEGIFFLVLAMEGEGRGEEGWGLGEWSAPGKGREGAASERLTLI